MSASRCSTSTSPASSSCTWRCSTRAWTSWWTASAPRWRSTADNKQRVAATFAAYFEYVGGRGPGVPAGLRVGPGQRARGPGPAGPGPAANAPQMISQVVREDAGLADDEAHLLSVGMVGMAQVTARYWLTTRGRHPAGGGRAARGQARLARHQRLAPQLAHQRETNMEVKIGIQSVPRELVVETDTPAAEIERRPVHRPGAGRHAVFAPQGHQGRQGAGSRGQDRLRGVRRRPRRAGSVSAASSRRRPGLGLLLVSWAATGQWNDITRIRVVQSAAVFKSGRRARRPLGESSAPTAVTGSWMRSASGRSSWRVAAGSLRT